MFKKAKPAITGADMLLVMADQAETEGLPHADRFFALLHDMLAPRPGGALWAHEGIARGPLPDHDNTAAGIVSLAAQGAFESKDLERLYEVAMVGVAAIIRWPRYLAATADGHPELEFKAREDEQNQSPRSGPGGPCDPNDRGERHEGY